MFTQRDYKRNTYNKKEIDLCPNYCSLNVNTKKKDNTETNTQKQDNTETNTQRQKERKITLRNKHNKKKIDL